MSSETWTINAFADASKIDRRALTKWLADYEPAKVEGRSRYYSLPDIVAAIRKHGATKSSSQDEEKAQRIRRLTAQADQIEMENRVREDELLEVDEIGAAWNQGTSNIKTNMLSIPATMAPILAAETNPIEIEAALRESINESLTALADDLFGAAPATKDDGKRMGGRKPEAKSRS